MQHHVPHSRGIINSLSHPDDGCLSVRVSRPFFANLHRRFCLELSPSIIRLNEFPVFCADHLDGGNCHENRLDQQPGFVASVARKLKNNESRMIPSVLDHLADFAFLSHWGGGNLKPKLDKKGAGIFFVMGTNTGRQVN